MEYIYVITYIKVGQWSLGWTWPTVCPSQLWCLQGVGATKLWREWPPPQHSEVRCIVRGRPQVQMAWAHPTNHPALYSLLRWLQWWRLEGAGLGRWTWSLKKTQDIEIFSHQKYHFFRRNIQLKFFRCNRNFFTSRLQCFYQNCTNLHAMLYGKCNCKYLQLISLWYIGQGSGRTINLFNLNPNGYLYLYCLSYSRINWPWCDT